MLKARSPKVIIGLASFCDTNYGLFRNGELVERGSYLKQCVSLGFHEFDGAQLYGNFEADFDNFQGDDRISVYTKISDLPFDNLEKRNLIANLLKVAAKLPSKRYKGVYFHNTNHECWKSAHAADIATRIIEGGIGDLVGVSAYTQQDLEVVSELSWCNLVQVPLNPLFVPNIACLPPDVTILYRSIFLQGALLKPEMLSKHPQQIELSYAVQALRSLARDYGMPPAELMTRFALSFTKRPRTAVVVGARSTESLEALVTAMNPDAELGDLIQDVILSSVEQNRSGLVDPRTWAVT